MVYCRAVSLDRGTLKRVANFSSSDGDGDDSLRRCEEMNSFSETRAREVMVEQGNRAAFQWRHSRVISRVYPKVDFLQARRKR